MEKWLADVFSYPDLPTTLSIAAKTTVIYICVVVGMRVLGTRALGQMNAYDFVLVVVIANAVQNALVGGDNTLAGGLVSALTLLVVNRIFTWVLNTFPWLEHQMVGQPVVLVSSGRAQWESLRREGIDRDELMAALHEHGVAGLDDVRLAVLEVDGSISVVPKESVVHQTHQRRRRFRGLRAT